MSHFYWIHSSALSLKLLNVLSILSWHCLDTLTVTMYLNMYCLKLKTSIDKNYTEKKNYSNWGIYVLHNFFSWIKFTFCIWFKQPYRTKEFLGAKKISHYKNKTNKILTSRKFFLSSRKFFFASINFCLTQDNFFLSQVKFFLL